MIKNLKKILLLGIATTTLWTSCTRETTDPNADLKVQVINNYCEIVFASYEDSYDKVVELQKAINTLVATPNQVSFDAAKTAWKEAREPYGQTEAFRFYDGPIDDSDGPEGAINAWPLDEIYIDYTRDASGSGVVNTGIIHDLVAYPAITAEVLSAANEQGGEKNISIGFHAIEFLLWGQDFEDVNTNVGLGGDRSYIDYTNASINYDRRGAYIKACAQLLVDNLASLKTTWAIGGSYRTYFKNLKPEEALTKILTGVGVLSKSELAGERMFTALEANAVDNPQEDEHSCFSDNTHRDIITNALGISNVLTGLYIRTSGISVGNSAYSILALTAKYNAVKSTELASIHATVTTKIAAIPTPFDKTVTEENVGDNGPILQAVTALQEQGDKIAEAAGAIGLTISTELPE